MQEHPWVGNIDEARVLLTSGELEPCDADPKELNETMHTMLQIPCISGCEYCISEAEIQVMIWVRNLVAGVSAAGAMAILAGPGGPPIDLSIS